MFKQLAVVGRTVDLFFVGAHNIGLSGIADLLFFSRFSDKERKLNIKSMNRQIVYRGKTDRKTLYPLYSRDFIINDTPAHPIKTIVDAGANIGDQTIRFRHFYPGARIVAVEPEPGNCDILRKTFHDDSSVAIVEGALWKSSQDLALQIGESSVAHSVGAVDGATATGGTVRAYSVPDLMRDQGLAEIDLLKLDVEGAELDIFENAGDWIDRVNAVVFEPHDRMRHGCAFAVIRNFIDREFDLFIGGEYIIIIKRGLGWTVSMPLYY